jgi:putative spermidine/putrescine transport system substrate-binding protein
VKKDKMKKTIITILIYLLGIILISGCTGKKDVVISIWNGNEQINQYLDEFVRTSVKESYKLKLKRIPMDISEYMYKLQKEKEAGIKKGKIDVVSLNSASFYNARENDLLYGPFTNELFYNKKCYDTESRELNYDLGTPIEGYEAIWGKTQLMFAYNTEKVQNPPKSYAELLEWAKLNPGKFTYPEPPDQTGSAFIRNAYFELTNEKEMFYSKIKPEDLQYLSTYVITYFKELNKYLWNNGETYPANQYELNDLFQKGVVFLSMGYSLIKPTEALPNINNYVFETGSVGSASYLAIPFNAPNKDNAINLINYLQSPTNQFIKINPDVWGDFYAIDISRLNEIDKMKIDELQQDKINLQVNKFMEFRLPDMNIEYHSFVNELWEVSINGN